MLARPPIERYGNGMLSGATMLIGGTVLLLGSLSWEPNSTQSVQGLATFGWLFLLLFGSLVGYSLYMQLLRDLGPAKAGSFASVSPIIAVLVGVIAAGETVYALSVAGMAVMLVAARRLFIRRCAGSALCFDRLQRNPHRTENLLVQHSDEVS